MATTYFLSWIAGVTWGFHAVATSTYLISTNRTIGICHINVISLSSILMKFLDLLRRNISAVIDLEGSHFSPRNPRADSGGLNPKHCGNFLTGESWY
jgi:hypothetical protein